MTALFTKFDARAFLQRNQEPEVYSNDTEFSSLLEGLAGWRGSDV